MIHDTTIFWHGYSTMVRTKCVYTCSALPLLISSLFKDMSVCKMAIAAASNSGGKNGGGLVA